MRRPKCITKNDKITGFPEKREKKKNGKRMKRKRNKRKRRKEKLIRK
jgi:hypothetical protein